MARLGLKGFQNLVLQSDRDTDAKKDKGAVSKSIQMESARKRKKIVARKMS
jgi:hypothetical protein